jgi:hypothetical protein
MTEVKYEKLPEWGLELKSVALNASDRRWVPLLKGKYTRFRFPNYDAAEDYLKELHRTQPHLELRVVPCEVW